MPSIYISRLRPVKIVSLDKMRENLSLKATKTAFFGNCTSFNKIVDADNAHTRVVQKSDILYKFEISYMQE